MSVPGRAWIYLLAALPVACLPVQHGGGRESEAVTLKSEELARAGGVLLDALRARVPNMHVRRRPGACPLVTFRGQRTVYASPDPTIYVDGSPAKDTCILEQIRVLDVDRVEVYTSGSTLLPGYLGNPNGLILVFLVGRPEVDEPTSGWRRWPR